LLRTRSRKPDPRGFDRPSPSRCRSRRPLERSSRRDIPSPSTASCFCPRIASCSRDARSYDRPRRPGARECGLHHTRRIGRVGVHATMRSSPSSRPRCIRAPRSCPAGHQCDADALNGASRTLHRPARRSQDRGKVSGRRRALCAFCAQEFREIKNPGQARGLGRYSFQRSGKLPIKCHFCKRVGIRSRLQPAFLLSNLQVGAGNKAD
jgi:hypothetical protein